MRRTIGSMAAAFLLLHSLPALAEKPGAMVSESASATAKVEAVNKETREITLVGADGEKTVFKAGPEVRNFDQVKVGDKVTAKTVKTLAVYVAATGEAPSASASESLDRAPLGQKPGGKYVRTVSLSAAVEDVDLKARTLSLRGPKGNVVSLPVEETVKNLDKVKKGDTVKAEYVEEIEISVTAN